MSTREDTRSEQTMDYAPFYKTRMGQSFYDRTVPALVKQLERLNELLERVVDDRQDPPDSES